jgi:hypothetical protein
VTLPIHRELKAILAGSAIDHLTFLTTATGKPFAPGAFTNWFGLFRNDQRRHDSAESNAAFNLAHRREQIKNIDSYKSQRQSLL